MALELASDSYRILAVDDSPDNLFLVESILDDPGYQIICVESGQAALTEVYQSPPDVILLDVMMPGLDGYEVTQKIRQNPDLPYIPILLITAHDQSSLVQGLDVGADDFIRKPVDVNELRARVRSLLRLKRSMDAQAAMIQQRDDFVARLTHDLRTPLVAAIRMLKLCQEEAFGPLPAEAQEAIGSVISNNDHLLSMVNTLLEVYRHEAGHKNLTLSTVNLLELTQTVVQELTPLAAAKQLSCQVQTEGEINSEPRFSAPKASSFKVAGDYLELRRVITNLVGNAVKFTDSGSILVTVGACQGQPPLIRDPTLSPDTSAWVWVRVKDTGIGISEADQQNLFQWFRQGNHRRSGNGLGLHLAQRIAKLHGGTIEVASTVDQGSCFTLYLPASLENTKAEVA
ncbi:MAG: hybrid sensor histidine kinase/response regulator [Leptolyngbyaceae cyanobacterium SM2_3_12]|nr:hybrid sensor histidine kinase/response regulator [Leptolyngbyaceae cyanobacterium SM2_3_12]